MEWPYDALEKAQRMTRRIEDGMNDLDPVAALQAMPAAQDAMAEVARELIYLARAQTPPVTWKRLGLLTGMNPQTLSRWFG